MSQNRLYPELYSHWLSQRLDKSVHESLATCNDCAMVKPTGLTRHPGPFEGDLKCCTYFPYIPNFSWGAMLLEAATNFELQVRLKTAEGQGILLPLGLFPTPERKNAMAENAWSGFGQKRELLCPFFNSKTLGCSAWKQRPGVCTTYFCKSDRGQAGLNFWGEVETYLNHFEWQFAQNIFTRLGLGENEMEMCKAVMTTEEVDEERVYFIDAAWGAWLHKKEDFFKAAYSEAMKTESSELDEILGEEFLASEEVLRGF